MSSTGRNLPGNERVALDFYETPLYATIALYEAVYPRLPLPTLDPAAGRGALLRGVANFCAGRSIVPQTPMFGIEVYEERVRAAVAARLPVVHGDGLAVSWRGEHVCENPPFYLLGDFVEKAILEAETAAILAPLNFQGAKCRHDWWNSIKLYMRSQVILSERPKFRIKQGGNGVTLAGDSIEYAWFIFSRYALDLDTYYWISDSNAVPRKLKNYRAPIVGPALGGRAPWLM